MKPRPRAVLLIVPDRESPDAQMDRLTALAQKRGLEIAAVTNDPVEALVLVSAGTAQIVLALHGDVYDAFVKTAGGQFITPYTSIPEQRGPRERQRVRPVPR